MQRILPLLFLWLVSHTVALAKGGDEPVGQPAKTKAVSRYRAFMPAQQQVVVVSGDTDNGGRAIATVIK